MGNRNKIYPHLYSTPTYKNSLKKLSFEAVIGIVAGGGRIDMLKAVKAGSVYHKYEVNRNSWPSANVQCVPK